MDLYVTLIGRVYLVTIILYKKAMELFWYCDGRLVVTVNRLPYKIGVSLFFYKDWLIIGNCKQIWPRPDYPLGESDQG